MVFSRIDDNQKEIIAGLRKIGASVVSLAAVKKGLPDIIVGYQGVNYLFEIKDGSKPASRRKLTPSQEILHANWKGQIAIVNTLEEAIAKITKNILK